MERKNQVDREKSNRSMDLEIYKHIKNSGIVEYKIREIADHPIFYILSKHDPYWDSEHELEADKLDDIRSQLSKISNDLQNTLFFIDELDRKSFI